MVLDDVTEYEITPTGRKEVNSDSDLEEDIYTSTPLTKSLELATLT